MKIACASNDGRTIAGHFGHCLNFIVITVEEGRIAERDVRPAAVGMAQKTDGACFCRSGGAGPAGRLAVLQDCQAVLCLGMGDAAAEALRAKGITPVILDQEYPPDVAALRFARGEFTSGNSGASCGCHS